MTGGPLFPLDVPPIATTATDEWRRRRDEQGGRPTADGTRGRGSYAHQCARRIGFADVGQAPDVPDSNFNLVTWEVGQWGHDVVQKYLLRHFAEARIEVPVTYRPDRDVSGNIDGEYHAPRLGVVDVEIKTMRQYGFDLATGAKPGKPGEQAGPKVEHLEQVGIYALAPREAHPDGTRVDREPAAAVHMVYVAKDTGHVAEWIIPVEQPLSHLAGQPTVLDLAAAELARMERIFATVDRDQLPARDIPGYGLVNDPKARSAPWNCRYCPFQPSCSKLPSGPVPLEQAIGLKPKPQPDPAPAEQPPAQVLAPW